MAQFPLSPHVPIVDKEGRPTPEFLRWTQTQRDVNEDIIPLGTVGEVSDVLDTLGDDQGSVLYRGSSNWQALAPGTAGKVLQTNGPAANPTWETPAAGGGDAQPTGQAKFTKPGNIFTVSNSGTPTENAHVSSRDTWRIFTTGSQGNAWAFKSVTASTDFDIVIHAHYLIQNDSFSGAGVWFGQASTNQRTGFMTTYTGRWLKQFWNGTTFESESVLVPLSNHEGRWRVKIWYRLKNVSGTVTVSVSFDGLTFIDIGSGTSTESGLTDIDRVGIYLDSNGMTANAVVYIEAFGWDEDGPQDELVVLESA